MKRYFLLTLIISLNIFSAFSIYPIIRNFTRNDYKAGAQNWGITQNESKCTYFANNNGLLEFDGINWVTYPIANSTIVRSVMYDKELQRIYAGATNEFGYYQLDNRGQMKYYSLRQKCPTNTHIDEVWNIHKKESRIYFQTHYNILEYKNDKIKVFKFNSKIDCSAVINNSLIIASQDAGVMILSGDMFIKLSNSEVLSNKRVCAILPYKNGTFFLATDLHGLYLYDGDKIIKYETDIDHFIKKHQVFCAAINEDQIAFGTVSNGLVLKNIKDNATIYSNTFSGLKNNTILSLFFDIDKNLWLGLDKGIDYAIINSSEYSLFGSENLYGTGYASLIDNNKLYLGTNQGLYYMSYPLINSFEPSKVYQINSIHGQVWCLTNIDNTIFCGSDRGGFILKDGIAEQIEELKHGVWKFVKFKKRPNYLLGCSYEGLFVMKKEGAKWKFSNYIKGFKEASIIFEEDNDGFIWMNHWINGLFRISLNATLDSVASVESLNTNKGFPTEQNNVPYKLTNKIIFSSDGGFFKYNHHSQKMDAMPQMNNLFKEVPIAMRVHQSLTNDLFFISGTFQGIAFRNADNTYRMDSTSLNYLRNKLIIGFENLNFIDKNNVLFSTIDGFSWIYIDKIRQQKNMENNYQVVIKNVFITNTKDSLIYGQRINTRQKEKQQLASNNNSLRIEFVAPEHRRENATMYSYYMENYDKEWSDFSPTTIKEYTKLGSGTYTFRVKAKNKFNTNIVEDTYTFEILPPWYLSTIAYSIYILIILICMWVLVKFVDQQSKRRAKQVELFKNKEIEEQEKRHVEDFREKENEIVVLKNKTLEYTLKLKNQELANSTLNLIQKKEILFKIKDDINKIHSTISERSDLVKVTKQLNKIKNDIRENIEHDNDWQKFEENFDFVYEDYLKSLSKQFPQLNVSDKKLCAYLKMDLSSKNIAPLMNISVRSVEMARYRLRKKMGLNREVNLSEFLQNFNNDTKYEN